MAASSSSGGQVLLPFLILVFFTVVECVSISYETGKTYKYSYETSILFNDFYSKKSTHAQGDIGYNVQADFELTPIFDTGETQLMKIQVVRVTVSSVARADLEQSLLTLSKYPIYFEWSRGMVGKVYNAEGDSTFSTNIKKGIISMFQVQGEEGERAEMDVSGECSVSYIVKDATITKTKTVCRNLEIAGQFAHPNKMLGVSIATKNTWVYQVEENVIIRVTGQNRYVSVLNIRPKLNTVVLASQRLSLQSVSSGSDILPHENMEDAIENLNKVKGYSHIPSLLPSMPEVQHCKDECQKPLKVLSRLKSSLTRENLATVDSAKAFLQLLRTFRSVGKETVAEILTSLDSYNIVPQLIDAAVATQTPAVHRAMMELLNFNDDYAIEYPERFLFAAAYSSHPGDYLLKDILKLLKNKLSSSELQESVALGMGAVVYTYCRVQAQCKEEVITDYKSTVLTKLQECKENSCKLTYLRSMGNSGLGSFVVTLVQFAEESDISSISLTAIQALRRIPQRDINDEVLSSLLRIFHQNQKSYDSSVRLAALEVILRSGPSHQTLRNILLSAAGDQEQFEMSTYVIRRVIDMAQNNKNLKNTFSQILKDIKINNYNVFAQKGKSSAFSSVLAGSQESNCTYGLYMENSKMGVMKRSAMVVDLVTRITQQPFLTFSLYGDGLEALKGGDEAAEGTEEVEPSAGMSLTLMDVLLRPVEFFRGLTGLMAAAWSAPSELTSALQGNLLLHDHSQRLHMANGMIVDLQVQGVLSMDLSGSIIISFWNRNAQSLIKNSGALVIEGSATLVSEELQGGISFSAEGMGVIDFHSDVQFYEEPFQMCLQMKRPPLEFRHFVTKNENTKIFKKNYHANIKKTLQVEPVSFFIHQQNSEECKILIQDED